MILVIRSEIDSPPFLILKDEEEKGVEECAAS